MAVQDFRGLVVWQKSMTLARRLYEITRSFPKAEQFGLTSQMRRAGISVPENIAEGHSRMHRREFINFLSISRGSLAEVMTYLILSADIGFLEMQQLDPALSLCDEISRMLTSLRRSLEAPPS